MGRATTLRPVRKSGGRETGRTPRNGTVRALVARHKRELASLRNRLSEAQADNERLADQSIEHEQKLGNLMSLFVTSQRLHETLERERVLQVIREIVANLIGSEEMALFWRQEGRPAFKLLTSMGIDSRRLDSIHPEDGVIGEVVRSGHPYVTCPGAAAPTGQEAGLTACVPLKVEDRVVGSLAIFGLLQQKAGLESVDLDLLKLLATQAAMALYCTDLNERAGPVRR
jgi:nitrate/nitrite-specific signal transduction histidine kinase